MCARYFLKWCTGSQEAGELCLLESALCVKPSHGGCHVGHGTFSDQLDISKLVSGKNSNVICVSTTLLSCCLFFVCLFACLCYFWSLATIFIKPKSAFWKQAHWQLAPAKPAESQTTPTDVQLRLLPQNLERKMPEFWGGFLGSKENLITSHTTSPLCTKTESIAISPQQRGIASKSGVPPLLTQSLPRACTSHYKTQARLPSVPF